MTPTELLSRLLPIGSQYAAVGYKVEGRKAYAPTPIESDEDRQAIIAEHLAGEYESRLCVRKAGGMWLLRADRSLGYGAYCLLPDGTSPAVCIDIDGPDHAKSQSEGEALAIRDAAAEAMARDGLAYFLERSHGAKGWHVWCIFDTPQPGAFAHWLAERIGEQARRSNLAWTLEAFPKQPKAKTLGSLVALPLPGRPRMPGGGAIVNADGTARDLATLELCSAARLAPLVVAWRQDEAAAESARRLRALALADAPPTDVPGSSIDLEDVVEACAPERVSGSASGEILMDCPRHQSGSGKSLQVNPEARAWYCHACRKGRSGEWAAFSLAQWLLPTATGRDVANKLKGIGKRHAV